MAMRTIHGLIALVAGVSTAACVSSQPTQPKAATEPAPKTTAAPTPTTTAAGPTVPTAPATKANWQTITQNSVKVPNQPNVVAGSISTQSLPQPIQELNVHETGFRVTYAPTRKPMFAAVRKAFKNDRLLENFASRLNTMIKLPRVIDIQMAECRTVNAFYDPRRSRIIVCYELVAYFAKLFQPISRGNADLGKSIKGATTFAFYHELGHALAHALKLPVVGREEDAVDQLATLILMNSGDAGVAAAMSGARWFDLQSKQRGRKMPFWDEHSLDPQRFYNIACLVFGSNPRKYGWLVRQRVLPMKRARRCPKEYQKIHGAWNSLLKPHLRRTPHPRPTTKQPRQPPTKQPQPQPNGDCRRVALHAAALLTQKIKATTTKMHPGQAQQTMGQLGARMPTFVAAVVKECRTKWSVPVQRCVLQSRTLKQAGECNRAN